MYIANTFVKRAVPGILAAFLVLFCSAVSWADTTIYVYQAANGALTVKTFDSNGNLSATIVQTNAIPKSCFLPELFWDAGAGALRINGFDASGIPSWTGTIGVDGKLKSPASGNVTVTCGSITPDAISGVHPDSIPCVSYTPWSACIDGFVERVGIPAGCDGQLSKIPCSTTSPPACQWLYGNWTPAACAAGSIQTRTASPSPSGCIGFPGQPTIQGCPPQSCTAYNYVVGTCQSNNTAPVISSVGVPQGCTGGVTPAATQPCTYGAPACTNWTYSAWSPADGSCTPGSTQTRQVASSSPAGCAGQPSSSQLSKTCPTPGTGGLQGTKLAWAVNTQHFPLKAGEDKLFNVTAPACTTTSKQIRFTLGGQQSYPASHILAKKVNGDPSDVPTREDYDAFYALTEKGGGPYVDCVPSGSGTCTSAGNFFWKFNGSGSGETLIIYPSYNNTLLGAPISLKATIPNFNQGGDYYLYVVNTSQTVGTDVYVRAYCY